VKVYVVGDYSMEICGGPHVPTRPVGRFKIQKEEAPPPAFAASSRRRTRHGPTAPRDAAESEPAGQNHEDLSLTGAAGFIASTSKRLLERGDGSSGSTTE